MKMLRAAPLCVALGMGLVSVTAMAASEQVRTPRLDGYVKAFEASDPKTGDITEYVPNGQTVRDWTDMVTVNSAPGSAAATPREFLGIIEAGWRIACPGTESNWLGEGEEGGRPVAVLMLGCPRNPGTGKPEFTWIKGIQGLQGFHTVQKSFRVEPAEADVVTWVRWLRGVTLCGNGEAPDCTPATP